MAGQCKDMTGLRFERLLVLERVENYIKPSKKSQVAQWLCQCDCGKLTIVRGDALRAGTIRSCGCLHRESAYLQGKNKKKYNIYDLSNEKYGIGYTTNTNEPFLFDLEDYNKIKEYSWSITKDGYILAPSPYGGNILLHRLIMNPKETEIVDHICHCKFDNRKTKLRIVTKSQNAMNSITAKNNTSGIKGVYFYKQTQSWIASIKVNQKQIYLGLYKDFDKAVEARKQAEKEYFGEYSYEESMKGLDL